MINGVRLHISGVNISKLYKLLKKNDIQMINIERIDHKNIYFTIPYNKQKKLFALLENSCYTINIKSYYGLPKWFNFFKNRFGYIIGLALFLIVIISSNFFIFDIRIFGNQKISSYEIINLLNNNGVKVGMLGNVNVDNIEHLLSQNFNDISLVSVIKKGTTIIINIKEKQSVDKTETL